MLPAFRPEDGLTAKEVAHLFRCTYRTVSRWKREGLIFLGGQTTAARVVWFLEQRDAARRLGIEVPVFLEKPREVREALVSAAAIAAAACPTLSERRRRRPARQPLH